MRSVNAKLAVPAFAIATVVVVALTGSAASAQEVIWDRQVRVGPLVAFPTVSDEDVYYYAGTRARLARERGLPKFSFVRFSKEREEGGDALGGGVIHAVVEMGVTEEQLQQAREALREVDSRAELRGPVAFKEGHFTLVSTALNDESGEIAKRIVGMGKAPLLEGDRAAVSMLLTADGANILWATFNTPTPDISFSFEMQLDAYRSPVQAKIEADWSKVYKHKNFEAALRAGVDSSAAQVMLGAEISRTYDELKNDQAIRITLIGEDESLERATEATYEELREIMFQPANMAGETSFTPEMRESAYDRASSMFEEAEKNREQRNRAARAAREKAIAAESRAAGSEAQLESTRGNIESLEAEVSRLEAAAESAEREYTELKQDVARRRESGEITTDEAARRLTRRARERADQANRAVERARTQAREAREAETRLAGSAASSRAESKAREGDRDWEQGTQATISAYVAYRMKEVRQSGTFRQEMTKYRPNTFFLRFDSNIGDLTRYLGNEDVFVERALDQMVFRQADIQVQVSQLDSEDFDSFLNSASAQLRKNHESGRVSRDDVVISKSTFEENEGEYKLTYVSDGDRDADLFQEYEYRVDWNYVGGVTIPGEWVKQQQPVISLSPPLVKHPIEVELDPLFVADEEVLGATIRFMTELEGSSIPGPVLSLRPDGDVGYAGNVTVVVPRSSREYSYTVDVTRVDGSEMSMPQRTTRSGFIVVGTGR